jgi:hypothetical protein
MGNDTAHNIHLLDTLPSFVDPMSMRIVMASHQMYTSKYRIASGATVLKFDYPNIKLLDSSYKGLCDGAVIYTINTKPRLSLGTAFKNRVGIYFDDNEVVMTNEAHTKIGCPTTQIETVSTTQPISIYPNPAGDILNVDIVQGAFESCTISNSIGSVVLSHQLTQTHHALRVQDLPVGVYYITLRGAEGVSVRKFVKG